jgi:hypothetical protein
VHLVWIFARFFRAPVKVLEHLSIGLRSFAPHGDQPVTVFAGNSGAVRAAEKAGFDSIDVSDPFSPLDRAGPSLLCMDVAWRRSR